MARLLLSPTPVAAAMIVVAVLLLLVPSASAEEGGIAGKVRDDQTLEPIVGADVTVSYRDNATIVGTAVTDTDGGYFVPIDDYGWFTISVSADDYQGRSKDFYIEEGTYQPPDVNIDFTLGSIVDPDPDPTPTPAPDAPYLQYIAIMIIVGFAGMVLYSKIRRDRLLDHAVRRRIYEYVQENPGQHYRAIMTDLELPSGMLSYHVNRLEKGEYLRSRQDGMYRRFFPADRMTEMRFFLSDIQENIIGVIRTDQGISQSRIADRINVTRKVVNYHMRILNQAGLVYMEPRGRETACFAPECQASTIP